MADPEAAVPEEPTPDEALSQLIHAISSMNEQLLDTERVRSAAQDAGDTTTVAWATERVENLRATLAHMMTTLRDTRSERDFRAWEAHRAAANKQSRQVTIATWVLAAATVVLAAATVGLIIATLAA